MHHPPTTLVCVEVVIRDAGNNLILEQGRARPSVIPDEWLYLTTTAIPGGTPIQVEATASDGPGHTGTARVPFSVV